MENIIMKLKKKADKKYYRVSLPKAIFEQWGNEYDMVVYSDHIRLIPVKRGR